MRSDLQAVIVRVSEGSGMQSYPAIVATDSLASEMFIGPFPDSIPTSNREVTVCSRVRDFFVKREHWDKRISCSR